MSTVIDDKDITKFTNEEIRDEYTERFGDPDDWDISEFDNAEIEAEYEKRFLDLDGPAAPDGFEEIVDLIAEAARTSPHAKRAYQLLRDVYPSDMPVLEARQRLIAGRMGGVPL